MRWIDIKQADRHALGTELLPIDKIRYRIPAPFEDHDRVMVFRYSGNLPMVGVRVREVFHVLWIEDAFGNVYDHG